MMMRENDITVTRDMTIKSLNQLLSEKRKEVISLREQLSSKTILLMKAETEIIRLKALLNPPKWTKEKPTEPGDWAWRPIPCGGSDVYHIYREESRLYVALFDNNLDEESGIGRACCTPFAKRRKILDVPLADFKGGEWSDKPIQMPGEE